MIGRTEPGNVNSRWRHARIFELIGVGLPQIKPPVARAVLLEPSNSRIILDSASGPTLTRALRRLKPPPLSLRRA